MSNFNTANNNNSNGNTNVGLGNFSNYSHGNNNNNVVGTSGNCNNVVLQTLRSRKTNKSSIPLDERVTLEKAFGFTIQSNQRISQSCDGTIAYLSGCVIVLYDCNKIHEQEFIISPAKKTLTCVAFSLDGRTIATGESGHEPKVRVWDVREKVQICEFSGHKFSIDCVEFSTTPNSNLLVSVGSMHDMVVNVWNCRTKFKVASNKIACKVKGLAFSQDGSYFVTVGNRHVKFWYLTVSSLMETVPLRGRAAILGDMKNNYFCDVVCGRGTNSHLTYAITTNGVLCEFNENRCLSSIAELHVERAYCIYADDGNLFIGCSNGTILIFRQKILDCISSLSRPHYLGVDISKGFDTSHVIENINNPNIKHPDCIALCYDKYDFILSAFYNDHSFYVWDIKDLTQVKKVDSHLFHSSSCGSIDLFSSSFYNNTSNELVLPDSPEPNDSIYNMPMDSFITCSSDNTLRIWSMNTDSNSKLKRNIYSKELLKIIYIDNDLSALCEIDNSVDISDPATERATAVNSMLSQATNKNSADTTLSDQVKLGARCIKISPFGRHLATGDRNGNIRIYDLSTLESICMIEAHIAEVLDLQYSQPESGRQLLASSSRDRLIHIFDASTRTYDLLQIIGDHSSAITAVRFCFNAVEKQVSIISCGADKSIMFRTAVLENNSGINSQGSSTTTSPNHLSGQTIEYSNFVRTSYVAEKQTFHDMNVDPTRNLLNTISQDRMIREYSIKDGKKLRQFKGSLNEDGYLLKMDIDRNGQLLATSCTDKIVYIWDLKSTECLAYLYGHSENINDLRFTSDGQYLITVGADGCLFMWRLCNLYNYMSNPNPNNIVHSQSANSIYSRNNLRQSVPNFSTPPQPTPIFSTNSATRQLSLDTIFDNDDQSLPAWARKKLDTCTTSSGINPTRSSWSTSSSNLENESSNPNSSTRRSGRAVWGPGVNTSFAVAMDSELDSLTSTNTNTDAQLTLENLKIVEEKTPPKNHLKNLNCIQFPSPCVNKDSYQVKQVSIEHKQQRTGSISQRPAWICSNIEDDLVFNLNRLSAEDSSSEDIESPSSNVNSPVRNNEDILDDEKLEEAAGDESNEADKRVEESSDINDDPKFITKNIEPLNFNSDYEKILNNVSPLLNTPVGRTLTLNKNCFSLVDNSIKLDCDMDNSLRRQSISARYLLRTAQQKENQETQSLPTQLTPSIKQQITHDVKENLSDALKQKSEFLMPETPTAVTTLPTTPTNSDFKLRSRTTRSMANNNFQLLYSHHTESSLSKAKPKQPQQFHSNNNISKEVSTSETNKTNNVHQIQSSMKRSPSVSSIVVQDSKSQESSSSLTSSSATSSTSSIKHSAKSVSAKSSPIKQCSTLSRSNQIDQSSNQSEISSNQKSRTSSSNLKKASSMVSLNQSQSKSGKPIKNNSSSIQSQQVKESTQTDKQFLPPKTVRQVKQRSADRQFTGNLGNSSFSTTKSTNLNSLSTFSEQNKHLRKLSNSIQNLHQSNKNILPPQAPPKSPSIPITIVKNEEKPEKLSKSVDTKLPENHDLSTHTDENDSDLMRKLKKLNSDQMSLSSSSVECLDLAAQNDDQNNLDNDLDLNNQPHSSSQTTNSLTSSSSSSCSLFENNTNQLIIENGDDQKDVDIANEKDFKTIDTTKSNKSEHNQRCSDGGFTLNGFSGLKKPVTFASLAAANGQGLNPKSKSANNSPNVISYTQQSKFNNACGFSNSKIDSIRSEFIQNVKNLQFVLSQGTKNLDDYAKYQQSSHNQGKSLITEQTHQQIQHQLHTFVKQLNAVVNASKHTTNASSNNAKTNTNNKNGLELA